MLFNPSPGFSPESMYTFDPGIMDPTTGTLAAQQMLLMAASANPLMLALFQSMQLNLFVSPPPR